MTRVYTKVPSMTTPKMLKSILRVMTEECFLCGAVPFLYKCESIRTDVENVEIIHKNHTAKETVKLDAIYIIQSLLFICIWILFICIWIVYAA